jgi:hypothetical protein
LVQPLAPGLSPSLVTILGQELSGVQFEGHPVGCRDFGESGRRPHEGIDVHPQRTIWAQREPPILRGQVASEYALKTSRAACRALRRLLDAARLPRSGQIKYISCSQNYSSLEEG